MKLARGYSFQQPERQTHVGYYPVDKGLQQLERLVEYRPWLILQLSRLIRKNPLVVYVGGIGLIVGDEVDNTRRNARDRDGATLFPGLHHVNTKPLV